MGYTSVLYAIQLFQIPVVFAHMSEFTLMRNRSPVKSAICHFRTKVVFFVMSEFTQVRNHLSVKSAIICLLKRIVIFVAMAENTQGRNHLSVKSAIILVAISVIFEDIKEFTLGRRIVVLLRNFNSSMSTTKKLLEGKLYSVKYL